MSEKSFAYFENGSQDGDSSEGSVLNERGIVHHLGPEETLDLASRTVLINDFDIEIVPETISAPMGSFSNDDKLMKSIANIVILLSILSISGAASSIALSFILW